MQIISSSYPPFSYKQSGDVYLEDNLMHCFKNITLYMHSFHFEATILCGKSSVIEKQKMIQSSLVISTYPACMYFIFWAL